MQLTIIGQKTHILQGVLILWMIVNGAVPLSAHEISLNYQYFTDDGTTVSYPGVSLKLTPWEDGEISISGSADTVSSASEHRTSELDTTTRASDYEHRLKSTLSFSQRLDLWQFRVGGYYSDEPDYQSTAFSFSLSRDLFQRNTTLTLAGNFGSDDIGNSDDDSFSETASRWGGSFSLTQVLSPIVISRFSASYSAVTGFQANPYRYALRSSTSPEFDNRERLPEERNRYALFTQFNIFDAKHYGAFHPSYRYYWDDWGIQSHELTFGLYKYLLKDLVAHIKVRFYSQTEADYYQDVWQEEADFMTSYAKYAAGETYLISMGSQYSINTDMSGFAGNLLNGITLNGNAGFYQRQADKNNGYFGGFSISWKW